MHAALLHLLLAQSPLEDGAAAIAKGNFEAARVKLEEASRLDPTDSQVWRLLGQTYLSLRQPDNAADAYAKLVKLRPYDEDALFRLAQVYLLRQDFPDALKVLENSRKVFDKSPQLELALGVTYYGLRRFSEAVDQFFKTIDLAPDVPQPYAFLIRMPEHLGSRLPELERKAAAFTARHPESPVGYLVQAKAIIGQLPSAGYPEEAERARKLLDKALELQEADADAHYQLGLLLERRQEFEPAAKHLERSIELKADDAAPHYRLARVYAKLGRPEDAAREREIHEKLSEKVKAP